MAKYRVIKYEGRYQVQKRIFFFFWRTIDHYNNECTIVDTAAWADDFPSIYTFSSIGSAKGYLEKYRRKDNKKKRIQVIETYE